MVELAHSFKKSLELNDASSVGELLHENWLLKKSLASNISSVEIDDWYDLARKAGATGGKILGAGAGGFLMVAASPEFHPAITKALSFLRPVNIKFEPLGSRIIFYN
jgi:D-glycero-alpha-D-manno-heptose-7-phosphate kinase